MTNFQVAFGTVLGSKHEPRGNNQDGLTGGIVTIGEKTNRWGVVLDGCSAGLRSEAGVQDALAFLERKMPAYIENVPLTSIPSQLIMRDLVEHIEFVAISAVLGKVEAKRFLNGDFSLSDHPDREYVNRYIRQFYLFTVLGFIQTDSKLLVFSRGDGAFYLNGLCSYYEQNNKPHYPAYFCVPWSVPPIALENPTVNQSVFEIDKVDTLLIGTDSWLKHRVLFEALPQFINYKNDRWLQRRIIIWSQDSVDPKLPQTDEYQESVRTAFDDDTTVLALTRIPE